MIPPDALTVRLDQREIEIGAVTNQSLRLSVDEGGSVEGKLVEVVQSVDICRSNRIFRTRAIATWSISRTVTKRDAFVKQWNLVEHQSQRWVPEMLMSMNSKEK